MQKYVIPATYIDIFLRLGQH